MERYHIFKLGLAIIFYAVYCIRPMMVYGLETDEDATLTKNTTNADDFLVYYQGVEGRPGIDFPVYSYIPRTGFSCKDVETGYYADLDTDCQVFHICEDGKKISFLCPNGTIFQQSDLICEWWFKVNCTSAPSLYEESAEHLREDSARRKAARRVHLNANHNHGAIMRMEERASVSASQNGRHFEVKVDETATKRRDRTGNGRALQQDFQSKNNQPTQNIVYDNEAKNRYKNFNSFDYSTTTPAPRNDLNSFQSYNPVAQSSTIDLGGVRYTTNDLYAHTEKNFAQQTNYNQNEYTTQPSTASTFVESFNNPLFVTTAPSSFSQDYSKIVDDRQSRYNTNDFTTQSYSKTPQQFSIQQSNYNTNQFSTEKPFVTTAPSSFSQEYSKTPQQFNTQQSSYNSNQFSTQTQSTTTQQQFNYNQNEFTTQTPFVSSTFSSSYSQIPNQFTNQQSNYNQNEFSTGFTSSTASTFVQSYSETPKISVTTSQPTQPTTVQPFISSTFKSLNLVKDKKYDVSAEIDFPVHESELNKSKIASKSVVSEKIQNKQQSTVALTKNNLLTKRLHSPADADETQIPQETASFIKNSHNSINNDYKSANLYPNHRATYSDLKNPNLYTTKQYSMISSVTPQYITTMPINNGKPFLGNRVGSPPKSNKSTIILGVLRNTKTIPSSTTPKYVSSTPEIVTADPNNNNNPEIYVQISGGNSNVRSRSDSATSRSLFNTKPATINLKVSSNGKPTSVSKIAQPKSTTVRVPLPLSTLEPPLDVSTRKVDHATVYGSFVKSRTTPVPGNQGVQIKFDKNSSKVAVQLSKSVLGGISSTSAPDFESRQHLNDVRSTAEPSKTGFYVTKENDNKIFSSTTPSTNGFTLGTSSSSYYGSRQEKLRPRPFQLPSQLLENELDRSRARLLKGFTTESSVTATNPSYKISSASPFMINVPDDKLNSKPTVPTSLPIDSNSVYENVDNMISVLMEIANVRQNENDYSNETPRPGLIIPPSAGPQTLHTLAVYFANALDGIVSEKEMLDTQSTASIVENKEKLTALLTQMTRHHYNELFKDDKKKSRDEKQLVNKVNSSDDGLEAQHSKNFVQTPEIRQLARNFSLALSMYLDNPEMFRKDLKNFRPTEPPPLNQTGEDANDEELLNFSDADSKSSYPPIFPTSASLVPTWGYILAYNTTKPNLDVRNSLNPDLQLADSQSFIPKFNNANADRKDKDEKRKGKSDLPLNHWTTSPDATKLWQNTFSVNPLDFNKNFQTTEPFSQEITTTEDNINFEDISTINPPVREIQYELHSLPKLSLNSTQVHGILIDFMNTTKTDDTNRLQRILRKLNTTEGEFLDRMKEIENNPLTRRLILLLISECGSNVTKQLENDNREELQVQSSNSAVASSFSNIKSIQSNSNIRQLVDPNIKDDGEDARALQLLNSLYTIASKFGK